MFAQDKHTPVERRKNLEKRLCEVRLGYFRPRILLKVIPKSNKAMVVNGFYNKFFTQGHLKCSEPCSEQTQKTRIEFDFPVVGVEMI
jgi:hypothetical protein